MWFTDLHLLLFNLPSILWKDQIYITEIENSTLKSIQINKSVESLDLSNLNLSTIDENAFANLSNLKKLSLANNKLKQLPALANLSNLESLNLADNDIESGKFYVGLSNLKTLNISNNPLKSFEAGHFFGLTKSANIFTQGLNISFITAAMFENPVMDGSHQSLAIGEEEYGFDEDDGTKLTSHGNYSEISVCIEDGKLTSVEIFENVTSLSEGCRIINFNSGALFLDNMGIRTFKKGWYQLQDQNVSSIVLSYNEIAELTKELLNDLAAGILNVHIVGNKIKKLEKGIIENRNNINVLDLRENDISKIDDGALEKLNCIEWLLLDDNRLESTKFLDSLPSNIQSVSLDRNKISEISAGDFIKFTHFKSLSLANNDIEEIKYHQLRGFSSLTELSLRMNRLRNIESGAFKDLNNLLSLDLTDNKISNVEKGIFSGLENIKHINLDTNEIEEILYDLLAKMPNSLEILLLGNNKIKYRNAEWLFRVRPSFMLWGRLEMFNIPNLKTLDLHDNLLECPHRLFFRGLKNLNVLSLAGNNIKVIEERLTMHLGNLHVLDLSHNPIKKLENGAFFGLPKDSKTIIRLNRVPLELIQGGLFGYI